MFLSKHLSIALSVTLIFAVSCSDKNNSSYERFNLKGKVKILKEHIYTTEQIEELWQPGGIIATTEYFFDESGFNTRNNQYFGNNELFSTSRFTYENQQLVREENTDKNGNPLYVTSFTWISDEEINFERVINSGEKVNSGKNILKNNKITKSIISLFNNGLQYEEIILINEFDDHGNIKLRTQTKKSGETEKTRFKYTKFDQQGNWTECYTFGDEGEKVPYNFMKREYIYY
jgi:hypothetical protein